MNGQYLSSLPLEEILPEAEPFFVKSGLVTQEWLDNNKEYFAKLVDVVRVRVKPCRKLLTLPNISLKMWKATMKKA